MRKWILVWVTVLLGCTPSTETNISFVCNRLSDAENLYAKHLWFVNESPSRNCEKIPSPQIDASFLSELSKTTRVLVHNDGESAIELYVFYGAENPELNPVPSVSVELECPHCEKGWVLGVNSAGVYQWCKWKGRPCVVNRVKPGNSTIVVQARTKVISTHTCTIESQGTSTCVLNL